PARCGLRGLRRHGRSGVRHLGDPEPGVCAVGARGRPRAGHGVRGAVHRPGGPGPARRRRGGVARRVSGKHRRPDRLRPVRAAGGARPRPSRADAAVDAGAAGPGRHAHGVAGGRRHQLPDGRTGAAAARLRPRPADRLETLDHVVRPLDPDDILITDETGPISMAGTMGGLATEISESSANLVIEAAHFSARGTARMSRRHRLFSEASYRFEREVDRELPVRASAKAAVLLAELGGATVLPGCSHAQAEVPPVTISLPVDYPGKVAGLPYLPATVIRRLRDVGCVVTEPGEDAGTTPGVGAAGDAKPSHPAGARSASLNRHLRREYGKHESGPEILTVVPPSWRQDLRYPSDLAEEVIRLEGYDNVP